MPQHHSANGFAALILLALLTACGGDRPSSPSQVLAKVNDTEITGLQLNHVLSQRGKPEGADEQALKRSALEQLVDQELLVQKAVDLKLDRDPTVLQAIEQSKRQVLAQAAAERYLVKKATPSEQEIAAFYQSNPALFSERKIYQFKAFSVRGPAIPSGVAEGLDNAHSADEVANVLTNAGMEFKSADIRRTAEQLPLPMLDKIATSHQGDVIAIPENGGTLLLLNDGTTPAPMNAEEAKPFIQTYLVNMERQNKAKQGMANLRAAAKVEYLQDFASTKKVEQKAPEQSHAKKL